MSRKTKDNSEMGFLKERGIPRQYLTKGKQPMKEVLKDMEKQHYAPERIERIESLARRRGHLNLTYGEAVYGEIRSHVSDEVKSLIDQCDETRDAALIANYLFCLDPEIRELAGSADDLYRIRMELGEGQYKRELKPERSSNQGPRFDGGAQDSDYNSDSGGVISPTTRGLIANLPREEFSGSEEYQRRLRVILRKKVEGETFKKFNENMESGLKLLDRGISQEVNENLRDIYRELKTDYLQYMAVNVPGINPEFRDTKSGRNTLPSLHQKANLHHIVQEKRFGVFDDCGTGKTATAIMAQPLIEQRMKEEGRQFQRTVVICPNATKRDAWERGLIGEDSVRYLAGKQDVFTVNGQKKDDNFVRSLEDAKWIVVNYEQLYQSVTVNGEGKDLAEVIEELGVDYTIIDEAHNVKNMSKKTKGQKRSQAECARRIGSKSEYLTLLTGTPIPDKIGDYAAAYQLLNPRKCPLVPELVCDNPIDFDKKIESSPRVLYTFLHQNTSRRTAEEINPHLYHDEFEEGVELSDTQKTLYKYLAGKQVGNWLIEARKAVLDPRLVDPEILGKLGLLGKVTIQDSSKYQRLEEILTSEKGPVANGEKFVIFSSQFQNGVTRAGHERLQERYHKLGLDAEYESLGFDKSLSERLEDRVKEQLGIDLKIGIIDGKNERVIDKNGRTERDRVVNSLEDELGGIACTTDSASEGIDLTAANWGFFLDRDYSPKTQHQGQARLIRRGQDKDVKIMHFYGVLNETDNKGEPLRALDEAVRDYVYEKEENIQLAVEGGVQTKRERALLNENGNRRPRLNELISGGLGGQAINVLEADVGYGDFGVKKKVHRPSHVHITNTEREYEGITDGQRLIRWMGQDKDCWKNPEFIELYVNSLQDLSVYPVHMAKIANLMHRAEAGEIEFPTRVLSEGAGPSLLYNAYHSLEADLKQHGFNIPIVFDRDTSQGMLDKGSNPNQILGDMTGRNSALDDGSFDMVDNQSLSLLNNPEEVKNCIVESNRILRPNGLMGLVVNNMEFADRKVRGENAKRDFYAGVEGLGFDLVTDRNVGFVVNPQTRENLKKLFGDKYAQAYANKIAGSHFLLARKSRDPDTNTSVDNFWFTPTRQPEHYVAEEIESRMKHNPDLDKIARDIERESRAEGVGRGKSTKRSSQKKRKEKREVRILPESIPGLKVKNKTVRVGV